MKTIEEVLIRLDQIVMENERDGSTLGYFPALYHAMTAAIQKAILEGQFDDGPRMERLDVLFAQRYLAAYDAWKTGKALTLSWRGAFEAGEELSVLQHLLLGIHAHINLDLGIAAAEVCPEDSIFNLQQDFDRVNAIISNLTEQVQERLALICPPFKALDIALRTKYEGIADFSIAVARKTAWTAALALAFLKGKQRNLFVENLDKGVAAFSQRIREPKGWVLRSALHVILFSEEGTIPEKIRRLRL